MAKRFELSVGIQDNQTDEYQFISLDDQQAAALSLALNLFLGYDDDIDDVELDFFRSTGDVIALLRKFRNEEAEKLKQGVISKLLSSESKGIDEGAMKITLSGDELLAACDEFLKMEM